MSGLHLWQAEVALAQYEDRLREAELQRMVAEALNGSHNRHWSSRLMYNLGSWLVTSGKRLQLHNSPRRPYSAGSI